MADKVRVAVIGTGQRGPAHAREILKCEETELALVCDLDEERAKRASDEFGVDFALDHRAVVHRNDIDAVSIATHTRHHAGVMRDAAAAGKPFLVEKPYADSLATGREICELSEQNGVVAMVGFQSRFTPFAQQMKALAEQIDLVQTHVSLQRGFFNPQYFFPEHYSGILDALSHSMDLALWWTGASPVEVMAHEQCGLFKPDKGAVEFAHILARCEGGKIVCMTGSMAGIKMQNIFQMAGLRGNISAVDRRRIRFVKHQGFNEDKSPIDLEEGEWTGEGQQVTDMWTHFATCVREGRTDVAPGASLREGLAQVAVSEAAYQSAKEGKAVRLAL
ncbi:MAG: Gfo/Idh/MocA family oxidoreductase [bacterium]|nr:Gfo/Idh/MocA family oxidoreductase [bacterium]